MNILARSKNNPEAAGTGADAMLRAEAAEVWRLTKTGMIRNIWFTHPARDAVIILECASISEAQALLAGLPLVKAGFIEFDVVELLPYDGFERLFEDPSLKLASAEIWGDGSSTGSLLSTALRSLTSVQACGLM